MMGFGTLWEDWALLGLASVVGGFLLGLVL